jgi:hypothetical protein
MYVQSAMTMVRWLKLKNCLDLLKCWNSKKIEKNPGTFRYTHAWKKYFVHIYKSAGLLVLANDW